MKDGGSSKRFLPEEKPWMNKLKVLQELAFDERISARIFKAIADPPTTSLQRLKGLTTGGLPTFIDVGNSFGAPAITEDNLIYQLVKNGKRVVIMGDDTWLQLFPDQFERSFPFPSFNVKDLHTVDDGCVDHLLPSLLQDDWDVLIAHFLGVDHAGHIFGVDSTPMIEKLKQYNVILEQVVEILRNQSGPAGLHENTLLLVMGDHGQTLNGDHGGGTPEEVETALFALSLKNPPTTASSIFDSSSCQLNVEGKEHCLSTIQQLDFSVTVAALLGVPFPFGSIGTVNHELFTLVAGTWSQQNADAKKCACCSDLELWMQNYIDVLCVNSWQVKRYIDLYSSSSIIGFSKEDMLHMGELYAQAQANYSDAKKNNHLIPKEFPTENCVISLPVLQKQISAYKSFLRGVSELAHSKWTEFDARMMGIGLGILLVCLLMQFFLVRRINKLLFGNSQSSLRFTFPLLIVTIRACSFLSNSYILAEGKVAKFLLATTGILSLRHSVLKANIQVEAVVFLLLNIFLGFGLEHGLSKQSLDSHSMNNPIWMLFYEVSAILTLVLLAILLYKSIAGKPWWAFLKYFLLRGTFVSYILIAVYWTLESNVLAISVAGLEGIVKNLIPRVIYAIGFALLALLVFHEMFKQKDLTSDYSESVITRAIAMISIWSPTVMIVLGRQGPFVVLVLIMGVWCITSLWKIAQDTVDDTAIRSFGCEPISVIQMNLLAVCLFFYTGHWCTFDGLRYGAAFVGFDDFNIVRQGILLSIDTFGLSHVLPIFCLPFLVALRRPHGGQRKENLFADLIKVFLMYGLATAVTTTFTIICVTIHRRHLMVWGLFAPKYVFDVVSLILTDVLICLASLFYY